jgi:hypothetical protein
LRRIHPIVGRAAALRPELEMPTQFCQPGALHLERRPGETASLANEEDWRSARRAAFPA